MSCCMFIYAIKTEKLSEMIGKNDLMELGKDQLRLYSVLIVFLMLTAVFIGRRLSPPITVRMPKDKRKLSKRTLAAVGVPATPCRAGA